MSCGDCVTHVQRGGVPLGCVLTEIRQTQAEGRLVRALPSHDLKKRRPILFPGAHEREPGKVPLGVEQPHGGAWRRYTQRPQRVGAKRPLGGVPGVGARKCGDSVTRTGTHRVLIESGRQRARRQHCEIVVALCPAHGDRLAERLARGPNPKAHFIGQSIVGNASANLDRLGGWILHRRQR